MNGVEVQVAEGGVFLELAFECAGIVIADVVGDVLLDEDWPTGVHASSSCARAFLTQARRAMRMRWRRL